MSDESAQPPGRVFARRVREARLRLGWTHGELANKIGIDRTTVAKLEHGKRGASVDDLFAYAQALEVPPVHLLVPLDDEAPVIVGDRVMPARKARAWIRGTGLRKGANPRDWFDQLPASEQRALVKRALTEDWSPVAQALMADDLDLVTDEVIAASEQRVEDRKARPRRRRSDGS